MEEWEQGKSELSGLISSGKYDSALKFANERIELAENSDINEFQHSNAYSDLGLIYQETGHYDNSKKAFEKALTIYPNNGVTYYNLGLLQRDFNQQQEAIKSFTKSIEIYSQSLNVYDSSSMVKAGLALASALIRTGELKKSNELIEVGSKYFLQIGDTTEYHRALQIRTTYNILTNKVEESLLIYRSMQPYYQRNMNTLENAKLLNDIGSAFYFLEQYDSAIHYFSNSINMKLSTYSDSAMIRIPLKNLASSHEQLGNVELAEELMHQVGKIKADNSR